MVAGTPVYKMVSEMVAEKIDKIGPEAALAQIRKEKPHYFDQVRSLCEWHKPTGGNYFDEL